MYVKMGFTPIKDDHNGFKITIGNMFKWCDKQYEDFILPVEEPKK